MSSSTTTTTTSSSSTPAITTSSSMSSWTPIQAIPPPPRNAAGNPIKARNLQVNYSNPPAATKESAENLQHRKSQENLLRKLNSPIQSVKNQARTAFERSRGQRWETVRNTVRERIRVEQNTKKRQRYNVEKQWRNAQWAKYSRNYIGAMHAEPHQPGVPKMGPPPRISNGMGPYEPYRLPSLGGKSRSGKSKRKNYRRKQRKTKKNIRK